MWAVCEANGRFRARAKEPQPTFAVQYSFLAECVSCSLSLESCWQPGSWRSDALPPRRRRLLTVCAELSYLQSPPLKALLTSLRSMPPSSSSFFRTRLPLHYAHSHPSCRQQPTKELLRLATCISMTSFQRVESTESRHLPNKRTYIASLEAGQWNPSLDLMARLAVALRVDLGDLVKGLQKKRGRSWRVH